MTLPGALPPTPLHSQPVPSGNGTERCTGTIPKQGYIMEIHEFLTSTPIDYPPSVLRPGSPRLRLGYAQLPRWWYLHQCQ